MKSPGSLFLLLLFISPSLWAQPAKKNADAKNSKSLIQEYKSKLEKARKKGAAREREQFAYLVAITALELKDSPNNPEIPGHYEEAKALESKIVDEGDTDKTLWQYVWSLSDIAIELGKFDHARELFEHLQEGFYTEGFLTSRQDSIDFLSDYAWLNTLFGENDKTYTLASDLPDQPSDLRLLVARAFENDQRILQAEEILLNDLAILKAPRADQFELYMSYLENISQLYLNIELYSKAHGYVLAALMLGEAPGKPELLQAAHVLAGDYFKKIGNTDRSFSYYSRVANSLEESDLQFTELLVSLADVAATRAQRDSLLKKAEKIIRSRKTSDLEFAMDLYDIAVTVDDRDEEIRLFSEALQIVERLFPKKNCFYIPRIYAGLGIAYEKKGRFDSALVNFEQARTSSEAMGIQCNKCHGLTLIGLGDAALNGSDAAQALTSYHDAEEFYRKIFGADHSYTRLASSRIIDYFWYQKDIRKTTELFNSSSGQTSVLVKTYFPSLTEFDREKFYENLKKDYDKYPSFIIDFYSSDPSLSGSFYNHQLQTKAFLLSSFSRWKNQILNSGDIRLIKDLDRWQTNKELLLKVSQLEQGEARNIKLNIDSLTRETDALEQSLYAKAERFSTDIDQPSTWEDVKAKLADNEAAIEIVRFNRYDLQQHSLTDSVLYCALIVKKPSKFPELVILTHGNALENKYLKGYLNRSYHRLDDKESYNVFWKQIQEQLKGIKKIYVAPDGVYHQININTLQNPATGKYVNEEYDLVQLVNTKEILQTKKDEAFNRTGLLFGSPDFFSSDATAAANFKSDKPARADQGTERGIQLEDLPGTKQEVESVAEIMRQKGWNALVYLNGDATEENLKSNYKPRVLHIATHGYFNMGKYSGRPIGKSGLIFSGGGKTLVQGFDHKPTLRKGGEDGILTPFEAMNLNLENTDLVVLSACQSGLGEVKPGEGIYGLQRAFKIAGARSLIISLWPVDDSATNEFITQFYKHWFVDGLSKAEAFRRAQFHLKQKFTFPYYWGAFILVGV